MRLGFACRAGLFVILWRVYRLCSCMMLLVCCIGVTWGVGAKEPSHCDPIVLFWQVGLL